MVKKTRGSARTPGAVYIALFVNLLLLMVALIVPRRTEGEAAAMLFAIPMALIVAIGAAAAIRAYILARREDLPPYWTAFLPLSVFLFGIVGTLALVYGWIG